MVHSGLNRLNKQNCNRVRGCITYHTDIMRSFFQHIIFLIGIVLELMIPDTPEDVELRIKREAFIANEIFSPVRNPRVRKFYLKFLS